MDKIKKLYIIDDDEVIAYLTNKIIKQYGFCDHFQIFNSAQTALERITRDIEDQQEFPEVILVDINMPVIDGWMFMDELVKLAVGKTFSIFVFTSSINPADREKAFSYPLVKGYIQKPLTVIKLNKILRLI